MGTSWKERIKKIIILGIVLGFFILTIQIFFDIPKQTVLKYYFIFAPLVVVVAVIINMIWQIMFKRKVTAIINTLRENNDADLFIKQNLDLLSRVSSDYNRAVLLINISVGYCEKKDYIRAKEILLSAPAKGLKGIINIIFNIDLAYYNFKLGLIDEAIRIVEENKREFDRLENHKVLGGYIAIIRIYRLLALAKTGEAAELLSAAKKRWTEKFLYNDYSEIEDILKQV